MKFLPGRLVQSGEHVANLIVGNVTRESCDLNYMFRDMFHVYTVTMPDAVALECDTTKGFTATPLLVTKKIKEAGSNIRRRISWMTKPS